MLIRFAVENYKSFKQRQVFSMMAGQSIQHTDHLILMNDNRFLKSSFFFGANASGKSNFVRAIDFMRRITLSGLNKIRYNDRYFKIESKCKNKPGVFQADFFTNGKIYSYGFAINYISHKIEEEWLYRINPNNSEQCIFERDSQVTKHLKLSEKSELRFEIYCDDLKEDHLLLTDIANKNLNQSHEFSDFIDAYRWFEKIVVIYPGSHPRNRNAYFLNPNADADSMVNMLHTFDTGIEGIVKARQPVEEALAFLPTEIRKNVLDNVQQELFTQPYIKSKSSLEINGYQFELSVENGEIMAEKIMLDHGNHSEPFEFAEESDGTKRLFDLIPLFNYGQRERIIIIDELDRSLHSKLTQEYIQYFFHYTRNKPSQLICTTHDINLLDLSILRKDEIWFVERADDHSTKLYSLNDYKQRFDADVLHDYIIGRYGAIPCFQNDEWQVNG